MSMHRTVRFEFSPSHIYLAANKAVLFDLSHSIHKARRAGRNRRDLVASDELKVREMY